MGLWKKAKNYFKEKREIYRSVTEKDVIAFSLENGNKITAASLAAQTELSVQQAGRKLYMLHMSGVFKVKSSYDGTMNSSIFILKNPELFQGMSAPQKNPEVFKQKSKQLTDAEVISAAVASKGKLIPGVLCIHAGVTIDHAQKKLQELQHKGVFDIEASETGAIVYLLNDYQSYVDLMGTEEKEFSEE